jgi:uncharacterized protein (DUF2267 family)
MDEIIKLVQEKVGISEDQARMAVTTVLGFVKEKLPEPIASQVDGLLAGGSAGLAGQAEGLMGGLGGLFGKKE